MRDFIISPSKEYFINRYKGKRTKFRILPGSLRDNSIDELYASFNSKLLPSYLKERMMLIDSYILKLQNIDLELLYYIFSNYGVRLSRLEKDFYKSVYDYKMGELILKKKM